MYILITLFFCSLLGIIAMVSRKIALIRMGEEANEKDVHPFVPDFIKIKNFLIEKIKKYEHLILVTMVRFSIRSSNSTKNGYKKVKDKIKSIMDKNNTSQENGREASKFLKMISDYKDRIRHIKHKIKNGEEIE